MKLIKKNVIQQDQNEMIFVYALYISRLDPGDLFIKRRNG